MSASETRRSRTASARQADRHDQVPEVVALGGDETGAERADQLELDLLCLDRLKAVTQELRVESDLERFAGERRRHRLTGLPHVLCARRHRKLPIVETQPQWKVALGHHGHA